MSISRLTQRVGGVIGRYPTSGSGIWTLESILSYAPLTIPGLKMWLDASNKLTFFDAVTGGSSVSDDGAIARWEDLSGNANHCTQPGSDSLKPILKSASINGLSAVRFDGIDDKMVFQNLDAQTFTVFCVGRKWNLSTDTFIAMGNDTNYLPYALFDTSGIGTAGSKSTGGTTGEFAYNSSRQIATTSAFQATQDSTISLWLNGSTIAITDTGSSNLSTESFNELCARTGGNAIFGKQELGELVFYDRLLSSEERNTVETYLQVKWGI